MPFTGGHSPSPERTGGGDAGSAVPRVQRIFEALMRRKGAAFDNTTTSLVGAEMYAYARAIDIDGYGANERFAREMNPATATVSGLLPRWEKISGAVPQPSDSEPVRQKRVAARFARFGQMNNDAGIVDLMTATLGPLFVGLTRITPTNAITWWPGLVGTGASVASVVGNKVTLTGLAGVPADAAGKKVVCTNATNPGNAGTFLIQSRVSATSVVAINNGSPVASGTVDWRLLNEARPWTTTLMHVLVEVDPDAVPGYRNLTDGSLNAAFFALTNMINPVLDWILPSDATFDWYVESSHGGIGWYLDEQNLDTEAFDS